MNNNLEKFMNKLEKILFHDLCHQLSIFSNLNLMKKLWKQEQKRVENYEKKNLKKVHMHFFDNFLF